MPQSTAQPSARGFASRRLRILSVFAHAERRAQVRALCERFAPGSQCLESATVTDAVLALLNGPVDLVLVDVTWAGDLLPGLAMHVRRSAPQARLLGFGDAARPAMGDGGMPWAGEVHDWASLPGHLAIALRG